MRDLRTDVDDLCEWRAEVKGALSMVKLILGTSIVTLLLSLVGLAVMIVKH